MQPWVEALSPDVAATWRRFPLSILLLLAAAAVVILDANDLMPLGAARAQTLSVGFLAGAAFALGGVLFRESRPQLRLVGLAVAYVVPLLAVAAHAIEQPRMVVAWPLLGVALLWTSVAGFTSGGPRQERERQFWWMNIQAAMTACIGLLGLGAVVLGMLTIQRALDVLLNLHASWLLEHGLLPVAVLFLAPVYWLSTLPRLDAYRAEAVETPDILRQALGVFGQFALAPLLLIYGAILLVYAGRIAVSRELPQGTIGWMVTGFVITGAVTWLILYAPFMRSRRVVRLFRRIWFWLTLIPLALLAVAVGVRIGDYGLTPERLELAVAGFWAATLAVLFLTGRGDIRLIPGLGAVLLLAMAVGPWSIENAPLSDQAARLEATLDRAGVFAADGSAHWTSADSQVARGAIQYLFDNHGRDLLANVAVKHGLQPIPTDSGVDVVYARFKIDYPPSSPVYDPLSRDEHIAVDLSATPVLIGSIDVWDSQDRALGDLHFRIGGTSLAVWRQGWIDRIAVPLDGWAGSESHGSFSRPWLDFTYGGVPYRLLADYGTIEQRPDDAPRLGRHFTYFRGQMFRAVTAPTPTP